MSCHHGSRIAMSRSVRCARDLLHFFLGGTIAGKLATPFLVGSAVHVLTSWASTPEWARSLQIARGNLVLTKHMLTITNRKCGRVVCATCSPHRITIPRQFIVHPPSEMAANFIDLTGDDENAMPAFGPFRNPALGGGEEVRVCNPCVPDPNFSPPPQYQPSGRDPRYPLQFAPSPRSPHAPPPPPHPRAHRSASSAHDVSRFVNPGHVYVNREAPNDNSQNRRVSYHGSSNIGERRLPPLPPSATQQQHPHHRAPLISQTLSSNRPRHRSTFGAASFAGSPFGQATSTAIPQPLHPYYTQLPQPRRQIAEEDECPICGDELPPKGPDGDETDRTRHIEDCIALHSASPGPKATPAPQTSASLPTQRTRGMSSAGNGEGSSNRMSHAARGMFPYIATEKDCVDDEGAQAECTICLEDFEAGDRMARLVCWCKFHEVCSFIGYWIQDRECLLTKRSHASKGGGIRRVEEHVLHISCRNNDLIRALRHHSLFSFQTLHRIVSMIVFWL